MLTRRKPLGTVAYCGIVGALGASAPDLETRGLLSECQIGINTS
jgi:hypothetical protein